MQIIQRQDYKYGKWVILDNGNKYSVVNIGAMMGSHPKQFKPPRGIFMGWEAILIKPNGELNSEILFREETLAKLLKILT